MLHNPKCFEPHTANTLGYDKTAGFIFLCIHNASVDLEGVLLRAVRGVSK
ncbi:hypothetical protein [Parasediminibacterium sp. JCM 36343]